MTSAMLESSQLAAIASAAGQAVIQVILIASAGAYMKLSKPGMKTLSDIAYRILLPSLMFTSVTEVISLDALRRLWVVPVGALFGIICGFIIALITAPWVGLPAGKRVPDDFTRTHFLLASAIGNHGYLPLILAPATILQGALHPGLGPSELLAQVKASTSYIALWILVINMFTWGTAAMLLKSVAQDQARQEEEWARAQEKKEREAARMQEQRSLASVPTATGQLASLADSSNSGSTGAITVVPVSGSSESTDSQTVSLVARQDSSRASSKRLDPDAGLSKTYIAWRAWFVKLGLSKGTAATLAGPVDFVTGVVTPPVAATFSGIAIGMIPPLKALLFVPKATGSGQGGIAAADGMMVQPQVPGYDMPGATGSGAAWPGQGTEVLLTAGLNASAVAVARALQACASAAAVGPTIPLGSTLAVAAASTAATALVRTAGGWVMCATGGVRPWQPEVAASLTLAPGAVSTTGPCCVGLGQAWVESVQASSSGAAGGPIASPLPTPVAAAVTNATAAAVSAAVVAARVPVAPLGPTITSALQSFAGAIVPLVALNLGSHIVAGDDHDKDKGKGKDWANDDALTPAPPSRWSLAGVLRAVQGEMASPPDMRVEEDKEPWPARVPILRLPVLLALMLTRLVLMPMVGIGYVMAMSRLQLLPTADRTLLFVIMLECCTPPAMNLQLIADIMGSGARSTARMIGMTYITSVLTITLWISMFLALIRGGAFD